MGNITYVNFRKGTVESKLKRNLTKYWPLLIPVYNCIHWSNLYDEEIKNEKGETPKMAIKGAVSIIGLTVYNIATVGKTLEAIL